MPLVESVEQPHDGVGQAIEVVKRRRGKQRVRFGFEDGHGLRHQLADNDVKRGHDQVADGNRNGSDGGCGQVERREHRVEQSRNGRLAQPAEGQGSKRDAQLAGGEVSVYVVGDDSGALRPATPLLNQKLHLGFANADERELGDNEKGVHEEQNTTQYKTYTDGHEMQCSFIGLQKQRVGGGKGPSITRSSPPCTGKREQVCGHKETQPRLRTKTPTAYGS